MFLLWPCWKENLFDLFQENVIPKQFLLVGIALNDITCSLYIYLAMYYSVWERMYFLH